METVLEALRLQADYCAREGSPFTARLIEAAAADARAGGPCADLLRPWETATIRGVVEAAVSLRLAAAFHDLVLAGGEPALAAAYPPAPTPADLPARVSAAAARHLARLAAFMGSPPQTNEARRAAALFPGFAEVAARTGLPLACLEIGASAGLLTSWDRFAYGADDGSWRWGAADASVDARTQWRGGPPPSGPITVVSRRASDIAPVQVGDSAAVARLRAYVWPEQTERMARLDAAVALAQREGVEVEAADAGAWVTEHLRPRAGVATVLYHSVMFQYLPPASRDRLHRALLRAAAEATSDAPVAWLRLEPAPGDVAQVVRAMETTLTLWPGGGERVVAHAHAHAAWVELLPRAEAAPAA